MTRERRESAPRLFEPNEMSFERTGLARLRGAVRAVRSPTLKELEADEDERTMKSLRAMADDLIPRFRLKRPSIEAERQGIVEHYGICYEDGESSGSAYGTRGPVDCSRNPAWWTRCVTNWRT